MIPIATTTITVLRAPTSDDAVGRYERVPGDETVVASGIRAHISVGSGRTAYQDGGQEQVDPLRLDCDSTDVRTGDLIRDDGSAAVFRVEWAVSRQALGLDHVAAGLTRFSGAD